MFSSTYFYIDLQLLVSLRSFCLFVCLRKQMSLSLPYPRILRLFTSVVWIHRIAMRHDPAYSSLFTRSKSCAYFLHELCVSKEIWNVSIIFIALSFPSHLSNKKYAVCFVHLLSFPTQWNVELELGIILGPSTIFRYFNIRPRGCYLVDMHSPSIPLTSGREQDVRG